MSLLKIQEQHSHIICLLMHNFIHFLLFPATDFQCPSASPQNEALKRKAEHWAGLRTVVGNLAVQGPNTQAGFEQQVSEPKQEMQLRGPGLARHEDMCQRCLAVLWSHTPQQSHGSQTPTTEVHFSNQTAISFDYSSIIRSFSAEIISFWDSTEPEVFLCLWNNCKTS